jgi:hypothetical protein
MRKSTSFFIIIVGVMLLLVAGYISSFGQTCTGGGACTLANESIVGGGPKVCPAQVSVSVSYSIANSSAQCSFFCSPSGYDTTFTPAASPGTCESTTGGVAGSPPSAVTSVAKGTFNANDCKLHNISIIVRVVNAQGLPSNYTSPTIGLWSKLNPNGSGNDCPTP